MNEWNRADERMKSRAEPGQFLANPEGRRGFFVLGPRSLSLMLLLRASSTSTEVYTGSRRARLCGGETPRDMYHSSTAGYSPLEQSTNVDRPPSFLGPESSPSPQRLRTSTDRDDGARKSLWAGATSRLNTLFDVEQSIDAFQIITRGRRLRVKKAKEVKKEDSVAEEGEAREKVLQAIEIVYMD